MSEIRVPIEEFVEMAFDTLPKGSRLVITIDPEKYSPKEIDDLERWIHEENPATEINVPRLI
jgi:hypothetical protein